MNKRIEELAKQAGVIALSENGIAPPLEKFAELIVKECLSYAKDGDLDFMKFMIKKHFGVKE